MGAVAEPQVAGGCVAHGHRFQWERHIYIYGSFENRVLGGVAGSTESKGFVSCRRWQSVNVEDFSKSRAVIYDILPFLLQSGGCNKPDCPKPLLNLRGFAWVLGRRLPNAMVVVVPVPMPISR